MFTKTENVFSATNARLLVFIKPFDENVFESFYIFVKFIEDLEKEKNINIEIITQKSMNIAFVEHADLLAKH